MSRVDVGEEDEPVSSSKTGGTPLKKSDMLKLLDHGGRTEPIIKETAAGEVVRLIAGYVGLACFRLQPVKSLDSLQDMLVGHAFRLQPLKSLDSLQDVDSQATRSRIVPRKNPRDLYELGK